MKEKKYYLILIALIAVGIGSVFMYRQQEEARTLEFEVYRISTIESRVDNLYNKDKTDIQNNISTELKDLEQVLSTLEEKKLSYRSRSRIENMMKDYSTAKDMFELQEEISELFEEESVVKANTSLEDIKIFEQSLSQFEDRTIYYKRNHNYISDARTQIETIEKAMEWVQGLTTEDQTITDLDEKELEEIFELIDQIKNTEIKERLTKQMETIQLAIADSEQEEIEESEAVEDNSEDVVTEETIEQENIEPVTEEVIQETPQPNNPAPRPPANTEQQTPPNRPAVAEIYRETKVEEVPFTTTVNESSTLAEGTEVIFSEGSPGTKTIIYEITTYTNGTSSKKLVSETITKEPSTRVVTVGTKSPAEVEEPTGEENE